MGAHSRKRVRRTGLDRRAFLGLLGLGAASVIAGVEISSRQGSSVAKVAYGAGDPGHMSATTDTVESLPTVEASPALEAATIPPPVRGRPQVISHGPPEAVAARQVAITIDDGLSAECSDAYVTLAERTGIHLTLDPNGCYGGIWDPLSEKLRPLIEAGQVQIANHTFNHYALTHLSDAQVTAQLERNEEWIQKTFGITARPWWRPPYGFHDERTDGLAAAIGYTNVLMWNGSYGDSTLLTPQVLLAQAEKYLEPGTVMLGHANHPTVSHLFPQIAEIIASRDLTPVTLDEMFGTSRSTGRSV